MDGWQAKRLERANEHDLSVTSVHCAEESFFFSVQGLTDEYIVEFNEDVSLWPPTCNCEDNCWRPDVLCKHIILCLLLMGVDGRELMDCGWQPQQDELYEILSNAPDCCGCTLADN